jgi:hypothetical protein
VESLLRQLYYIVVVTGCASPAHRVDTVVDELLSALQELLYGGQVTFSGSFQQQARSVLLTHTHSKSATEPQSGAVVQACLYHLRSLHRVQIVHKRNSSRCQLMIALSGRIITEARAFFAWVSAQ